MLACSPFTYARCLCRMSNTLAMNEGGKGRGEERREEGSENEVGLQRVSYVGEAGSPMMCRL